jgi:hypothetical protein
MSQQLIPISGGVQQVQTTVNTPTVRALSRQYIEVNNLESTPTEWVPGGRPIYRRLPAISETYQIDFFNLVSPPNTAVAAEIQDIGYVFVPWGESIDGPTSVKVSTTENRTTILVSAGNLVWKYGTNPVNASLFNLEQLDVTSGRYVLTYELVYDNSPQPNQYSVENFSLRGQSLILDSSSDAIPGWKRRTEFAFSNQSGLFWANYDSSFTAYAQPTNAFLSWEQTYPSAYTKVVLYQPPGSAIDFTASATLSIFSDGASVVAATTTPQVDANGIAYYEFNLSNPSFVNKWEVAWANVSNPTIIPKVAIQNIEVSGTVTLLKRPSGPDTLAALALYPENLVPETILNANGVEIPAVYCNLAIIDVDNAYRVINIEDVRYIIHRNYKPVANWLTNFWDDNLINLYEQVNNFPELWLNPDTCLKQEYASLAQYGILPEGTVPQSNIIVT